MLTVQQRGLSGTLLALMVTSAAGAQTTLIRVAQAPVPGDEAGAEVFDANVLGVIKPWQSPLSAQAFYSYDVPINASFNGPVPLTNEQVHLFFLQGSDGLSAFAVFDKPGNADGGRAQVSHWVRPSAAWVGFAAQDNEGSCNRTGQETGADSRRWHYRGHAWDPCCTDGWAALIDAATWTSFRVQLVDAPGTCTEDGSIRGLSSIAALSSDGSSVGLALGQVPVQFTPVPSCTVVGWPSVSNVCIGGTARLSARLNASAATGFVWRKNGVPVAISAPRVAVATSADGLASTLTVQQVSAADAGTYTCEAAGACGLRTSSGLTLNTIACSCTSDFNNDGDFGTDQDIEAFFRCLGGSCCLTCASADFNNDGDFGTDQDIEAFFRVLTGGVC